MLRQWSFCLPLVAMGLAAPAAQASFLYSDFSSTSGLQLNGSAAPVGNVLRLTPAVGNQSGSAFTTNSTSLGSNASFSTYFQFRITNSGGIGDGDGVGADGIVFVIQTVSNNVGGAGGGIGYQNISPSLGVEFDTYNNGGGAGDPNGNHVGIDLNGSVNSVTTALEPTRFNDGQIWNAWIDYNGSTNVLDVRWSLSTIRPTLAQLTLTQDLAALLGQNTAFVGFTAGTGAAWGNQEILQWEFRDSFNPIDTAVPEPPAWTLAALGFVGLAAYRRRYRKSVLATA